MNDSGAFPTSWIQRRRPCGNISPARATPPRALAARKPPRLANVIQVWDWLEPGATGEERKEKKLESRRHACVGLGWQSGIHPYGANPFFCWLYFTLPLSRAQPRLEFEAVQQWNKEAMQTLVDWPYPACGIGIRRRTEFLPRRPFNFSSRLAGSAKHNKRCPLDCNINQ